MDKNLQEVIAWGAGALARVRALNQHYARSMSPILNKTESEILNELEQLSQDNYAKIKAEIEAMGNNDQQLS